MAMLILGLALVALSQLFLAGMWTTQKARYLSISTQRAQAEMEKVQDLGMLTLLNGPTEESYPATEYWYDADQHGINFTDDNLPNGRGSVTWSSYPNNVAGNDHLLRVDIDITWEGASRSRSQVHVTTLLTNRL